MRQSSHEIEISTNCPIEFMDITDRVKEAVSTSGIREGTVSLFTQHTTTAIKVNERCDRLQKDMHAILEQAVPAQGYLHDEETVDGRQNGRGHLMALLLGSSETIPISKGSLQLGDWQSIFFVELDGPRNGRRVAVRIIGE